MKEVVVGKHLAGEAKHVVGCQVKHGNLFVVGIKNAPFAKTEIIFKDNLGLLRVYTA